ncbi:hypothetical protein KAW96_04885 [candidate division WOR-3 bacterium]|nr:hypothetical protein [candidate division WOR-3 bacterium]
MGNYQIKVRESFSTYLFYVPSFFSGIARIFDLGATFNDYNKSDNPSEADYKAIYSDWLMTGKDIESIIKKYKGELKLNISQ